MSEIDVSEYLPRQKVLEYLVRRKDIVMHKGTYHADTLPLDKIHELNLITDDQHWAGIQIINLRAMAFHMLSESRERAKGTSVTQIDLMTLYMRIMRDLLPWQKALITRICFTPVRKTDFPWIAHIKSNMQDAFDNLYKSLEFHDCYE